nr:MAG TPA: neurotoxin [Caudoviricetes sp.]
MNFLKLSNNRASRKIMKRITLIEEQAKQIY